MNEVQHTPRMTVSRALAAHACAKIAAARTSDAALHQGSPAAVAHGPAGFIGSWSQSAKVIGWSKPG